MIHFIQEEECQQAFFTHFFGRFRSDSKVSPEVSDADFGALNRFFLRLFFPLGKSCTFWSIYHRWAMRAQFFHSN